MNEYEVKASLEAGVDGCKLLSSSRLMVLV